MPIGSLIGLENCRKVVLNYNLIPVSHVKLLTGQEKNGVSGPLTDRYYSFSYTNKANPKEEGGFFCGYTIGERLLDLINHKPIPLFNPLASDPIQNNDGQNNRLERPDSTNRQIKRCKKNQQFWVAINLLCCGWNKPPYGILAESLQYIQNLPNVETKNWPIISLNNFLKSRNETLKSIYDRLAEKNNMKEYEFDELIMALKAEEKENHIWP